MNLFICKYPSSYGGNQISQIEFWFLQGTAGKSANIKVIFFI